MKSLNLSKRLQTWVASNKITKYKQRDGEEQGDGKKQAQKNNIIEIDWISLFLLKENTLKNHSPWLFFLKLVGKKWLMWWN